MKPIANILLLGAGAVGVLPAAKLLRTEGVSLMGLADAARAKRYERDGIFLNGEELPLSFLFPGCGQHFHADLVILAVKTCSLAGALPLMREFTGPGTIVLPLLNGITAREKILESYGELQVLHGLYLGHASVREGGRVRHDGIGRIHFGDAGDPSLVDASARVSDLFRRAGIDFTIPEDMIADEWRKFILNLGINQTQAVYRADYGAVQNSPELGRFARSLMEEGCAVARRLGIANVDEMIPAAEKVIREMPPSVRTSMLQDVLAGRETEVDAFAGEIVRLGTRLGIAVPFHQKVLRLLRRG